MGNVIVEEWRLVVKVVRVAGAFLFVMIHWA
jgi:hypothetical protein